MATSSDIKCHGTVTAGTSFNASKDAETLRKAMKGLGTDEAALIKVLTNRTNNQRQDISKSYKSQFGRDLKDDLKSETSGNFETVLVALVTDMPKFEADLLYKAMKGLGTKESILIEILTTRTNDEIRKIKEAYNKKHKEGLEKAIKGDTSGDFERLLVSLIQASRDETTSVDMALVSKDAQALYKAGEARWGTDEATFNKILVTRSIPHLRATFKEYEKISKHSMETAIKKEMSGDLEDGMIALVKAIQDAPAYFAEKLYKSMKGLGTEDDTLIRIVVTRCEVDMVEIKAAFTRLYPKKSLDQFIKDDTSGDYEKILLALIT